MCACCEYGWSPGQHARRWRCQRVGGYHTHTLTLRHMGVDKHFDRRVHRQKMLTSFHRSIPMPDVLAVSVAVR